MTTSIDFAGFMPMQWVFAVDPSQIDTSQPLDIKYGQKSDDTPRGASIEPGVYMFTWDTNMPGDEWKSFYFRDVSNFNTVYTNFGSREASGRQRVVIPESTRLYCYASLSTQIDTVEPVVAVSVLPVAPLANAFE